MRIRKRKRSANYSPRQLYGTHPCVFTAYHHQFIPDQRRGIHDYADTSFYRWMEEEWKVKVFTARRFQIITFPTAEDKLEFMLRNAPKPAPVWS